jgi:TolB-like protein/tetratricopeptide (TPR) repeat protein
MKGSKSRRVQESSKTVRGANTTAPASRWIDGLRPRWPRLVGISILVLSLVGTLGHFLGGVAGFWEFSHSGAIGRLFGGGPTYTARGEVAAPPLSIAILPFKSPSDSTADRRFADALTQDVTIAIAGWRWASVAAYGLASGYKDGPADARAAGRALNVRYVLAGDARAAGHGLVVNASLIDVSSGTQVWTDSLEFAADRAPDQPPVPHLLLAKRLRSALLAVEQRRVVASPPNDSPMDATLRGAAVESNAANTLQGIRAAREAYAQVLRRNPNFTPAMWRYVAVLNTEWIENPAADRDHIATEMDRWSSRAIKVDALDPDAWRARTWALQILGRWDEALAASDRARALFPASVSNVLDQAFTLNYSGRPEQALPVAQLALAMDPQDPGSRHFLCKILIYLGRYADAVAACEKAAALENGWFNQFYLAAAYANAGDLAKATIARDELLRQQPGFTMQRYREMFRSSPPAFFELVDRHIAPAMRHVGLANR